MAFAYSRLKDTAYLSDSAAAVITNAASTTTYVRLITLHNTHTAGLVVTLYRVPDNAGAAGTAGVGNQFYKETIAANETVTIEFPPPGMILTDTNDTIQGVCGTTDKVTISADGGTE